MAADAGSARPTTDPLLEVRHLGRGEWAVLRAVRLRALGDSPWAYTSTYTQEVTDGEDRWRQRFDGAHWLVATHRGQEIGLAGLVRDAEVSGDHYIESVWVAPGHRRRGVLRSMVGRLADIGRAAPFDSLLLWVTSENHQALRAYTQLGFVPTGRVQPLASGTGRTERQLWLDLRG